MAVDVTVPEKVSPPFFERMNETRSAEAAPTSRNPGGAPGVLTKAGCLPAIGRNRGSVKLAPPSTDDEYDRRLPFRPQTQHSYPSASRARAGSRASAHSRERSTILGAEVVTGMQPRLSTLAKTRSK